MGPLARSSAVVFLFLQIGQAAQPCQDSSSGTCASTDQTELLQRKVAVHEGPSKEEEAESDIDQTDTEDPTDEDEALLEDANDSDKEHKWLDLSGKTAKQSTTAHGGAASRAIDGNSATSWSHRSCTHTHTENNPWWEVDLGASQSIKGIEVTNRGDCCGDRLHDFNVLVGASVCASKVSVAQGKTQFVECNGVGSTVRVQSNKRTAFTICEVRVALRDSAAPAAPAAPTPAPAQPKYLDLAVGQSKCPAGFETIADQAICKLAKAALKKSHWQVSSWRTIQFGCFSNAHGRIWFNTHKTGPTHRSFSSICVAAETPATTPAPTPAPNSAAAKSDSSAPAKVDKLFDNIDTDDDKFIERNEFNKALEDFGKTLGADAAR